MRRAAPVLALSVFVAAAVGLSGCAPTAPDIAAGTSELMQSTIVSAADQAAAGDSAGSLTTLDSLQSQLDAAIGSGEVSAARAGRIQDAIDLVRADLQPAPAVAPEPSAPSAPSTPEATVTPVDPTTTIPEVPASTDDSGSGSSGNSGNGNGNNGNGNGNGNNGHGNGNGNGDNGNGKNK